MDTGVFDVVIPTVLALFIVAMVLTLIVCKYKQYWNMGKDVALRQPRRLWMPCTNGE